MIESLENSEKVLMFCTVSTCGFIMRERIKKGTGCIFFRFTVCTVLAGSVINDTAPPTGSCMVMHDAQEWCFFTKYLLNFKEAVALGALGYYTSSLTLSFNFFHSHPKEV